MVSNVNNYSIITYGYMDNVIINNYKDQYDNGGLIRSYIIVIMDLSGRSAPLSHSCAPIYMPICPNFISGLCATSGK